MHYSQCPCVMPRVSMHVMPEKGKERRASTRQATSAFVPPTCRRHHTMCVPRICSHSQSSNIPAGKDGQVGLPHFMSLSRTGITCTALAFSPHTYPPSSSKLTDMHTKNGISKISRLICHQIIQSTMPFFAPSRCIALSP
jgi:hypothetical protein